MQIHFLIECDDFEDYFLIHKKVLKELNDWLENTNQNENVTLVDVRVPSVETIDDYDPFNPPTWNIGLSIQTKNVKALKVPVNYLNTLSKKVKVDFSVNKVTNGQAKTVSYFGFNEKNGDIFEMWQFLS